MSDPDIVSLLPALRVIGEQIRGTKYAFLAFYSIYLYDFALTLPDEIEFIWKRKFTFVTYLFFMNRYYALGVFTVVLSGFFSPLFTPDARSTQICKHYSSFLPLAVGLPMVILPGIVMGLRVSALYSQGKLVTLSVFLFLAAEASVALWIYTRPGNGPLPLPPIVHGDPYQICIQGTSLPNLQAAAYQFMETGYDTIIFAMIIYKTIQSMRIGQKSFLAVLGAHGVLYFFVVFTCNFVWAMFIIFQPNGLKYSAALPTTIMGCVVVNRITLDLRRSPSTKGWFESVHYVPTGDSAAPLREGSSRDSAMDGPYSDSMQHSRANEEFEMSGLGKNRDTRALIV